MYSTWTTVASGSATLSNNSPSPAQAHADHTSLLVPRLAKWACSRLQLLKTCSRLAQDLGLLKTSAMYQPSSCFHVALGALTRRSPRVERVQEPESLSLGTWNVSLECSPLCTHHTSNRYASLNNVLYISARPSQSARLLRCTMLSTGLLLPSSDPEREEIVF